MKMLSIQHLLSVALITIATVNAQDGEKEHQGLQTCGGSLNGPVGLIHTPNCPNAFIVPIKCKWIMENVVNETISIYFTQQYTTSRLTFTEYKYYDDTYKLEERRALTVTEENITRIKWLQELAVNQRPEVWEGSQFILTFMAYGSLDIVFTWYKDGVKVNFNGTTREIWTLTVSEDALGRRMSVPGMLTMLLLASAVAGNAAAMFSLSSNEYHTAQDPYPMALSWVIGACWCAASAAFCTQPLLLDAELTGTTQRRHSVGLLAGVGVLCCLSARLWGGAALQVGSATNNILASGTLFLIMITLTLALCARRSVGYVTHKLALDRRTYIKNRSTIISVLSIVLITFATGIYAKDTRKHQGPQTCGGRLTGPVGLIQTPNFPNAFPVPIKCRWIIENIVNGTISIYFTQQYTTSGLTFTEYTYYDESYKLEERRALTVTDENITRIKWLQVQSPVLVVELTINRLEGTQLRALGLLTVFGFNMTYAVRGPADLPGVSSCSAIECRLLGHCFARHDYRDFYCSCFEDYSGPDCGIGPLCPRSSNMCRNGGTCRQMGPAAVSCICAPGYTGDLCEAQIAQPQCGKEQCSETCKNGTYCDCNPKEADFSSARFDTRLQVVDQPNINISQEIVKQLTSYLIAANITLQDTIEILNISSVEGSGARTVYVRVWSARQDAGPLRTALARLAATRARTHTLRLQPDTLLFEMQPALRLLKLEVNQRSEVWEGSEFILTCMAYGSPDIVFTWYKDGVKINFNGTTREIWTRTSSEDALGRRMSVLGVSAARQVDGGTWSCAADDAGRRRCRALSLTVLSPPTIRLVPSTLTVYKGDNVSITCLAKAGRAHGMLGFSWARERSLLPMQPDRHVWEDLYPAGSVLKLYNIQKSSEYRCQVSSAAGTNSAGMWVWALGADENACQSDVKNGLHWGRTAPGAHATISCPPGYSGEITRHCEPKTGQQGVKWMLPDFSECVADSLKEMYEQFMLISYGYSWGKVSEVLRQYLSVLRLLVIHRGAGATPLYHTTQMLQYLLSDAAQRADRMHSAPHLLNIYDHLLSQPDAFLNEQKIGELQNAVVSAAHMMSKLEARLNSFSVRSESGVHLKTWHAPTTEGAGEWGVMSTHVELAPPVVNLTIVTVLYHDLGARLPSLKKFTEHNGGDEVQYAVCSQQVQVYVSGAPLDRALPHTVTLLYGHSKNYSVDASKLACGLRSMEAPSGWRLSECDVRVSIESRVTCRCRTLGTIALLTRITHTRTESEEELRGIAVICLSVSGAMCVCACALQLLSLAPAAARRRDVMHMLLSASTAAGNAAAMFSLSPCYIAQQEPYPVTLGWVVAACWCAASAALCGQPLLLHAELAGTTQRQNSVGLLAGLCVLCCLSARLWGGAPLQVGSAANSIFTAGIVLLSALTLALALCARRTIGHVTHKLPPDRKAYTKNRRRVVNNTLALLLTSLATQLAGVVYAQPGEKQIAHVLSLSVATLANGVGMLVCYVIRDEQCLRAMRSILTLHDNADWHESPAGETSISLYIKQSGEAESHGGVVMLESGTSPVSSGVRYFHAAPLDRRRSNPDSRADIVRCVEYKPSIRGSAQYDTHPHPVCDLIPTSVGSTRRAEYTSEGYMATVCIEPKVLTKPQPALAGLEPYTDKRFDTAKETCTICVQSNPDVSKITFPPVKSCLKNSSRGFTSSTSLPSIDTIKDDGDKSHIEHINIEWNKAYGNPQADKVLNKISNDLDFLLNRMQSISSPHQIEEAPT